MKWILFYQTFHDSIKFITDELESPSFLSYYKFLSFLNTLNINDIYQKVKYELDGMKTIYIDVETKQWKIVPFEIKKDIKFEELVKLNLEKGSISDTFKDAQELTRADPITELYFNTKYKKDNLNKIFNFANRK